MRTTILKLVRRIAEIPAVPGPVYEFGSFRPPGHQHRGDARTLFESRGYVGCDLSEGPGVDRIEDLHHLTLGDGVIGTALLLDTIEHVREPWVAMSELSRCLRPGGLLVMASVMLFPIHAYPDDYWRFTRSGFGSLLSPFEAVALVDAGIPALPHTVVGVAAKPPVDPDLARAVRDAVTRWRHDEATSWKEIAMGLTPPVLIDPAYRAFDGLLAWAARWRRGSVGR